MVFRFLTVTLFLAVAVCAERARFDNYQVHRILPSNIAQLAALHKVKDMPGFSFWRDPSRVNEPVDIMVPPHMRPEFEELANALSFKTNLLIADVQSKIDSERPPTAPRAFGWTTYHTLSEINAWLDSLVQQYPGVVSPIIGGSSFEGRQIKGVKISYKQGNPGVFVEAGIHAREWISPATVTYILNQLLTSTDPEVRSIAENCDWYIFPSTNPDGYEYTHTTNRMWRKTRSNSSETCFGADPNRNWDFHWKEGGASSNPCVDTYAGSKPFSEVEIRTLSQYIASVASNIRVYLAFHNAGQMFLTPYGHTTQPAPNNDQLVAITKKAAAAISQRYGTQYVYGSIAETIYIASGSSIDWVYDKLNVNVSIAYELRDRGQHGFLLPAEQIIPTGEETLDSVVSIVKDAIAIPSGRS